MPCLQISTAGPYAEADESPPTRHRLPFSSKMVYYLLVSKQHFKKFNISPIYGICYSLRNLLDLVNLTALNENYKSLILLKLSCILMR